MSEKMLTREELQNCEISPEIIKEALNQSEKRMGDFLKTKDVMNQKLFVLFNGYIPVSIGLMTACFVIAQNNIKSSLLFFLIPLSCFFVASILFFVLAFRGAEHGSFGSSPDFWLQRDTISGDEKTLSTVLAYLVHSYQEGIEKSYKSNLKKLTLLHSGIYLSIAGIGISFIFFLLRHLWSLYIPLLTGLFLGLVMVVVLFAAMGCYFLAKHY